MNTQPPTNPTHPTSRLNLAGAVRAWLARLSPSETQVLVASGLAVGIGAGLGAVVFRYLINQFTFLFFQVLEPALATFLGSYAVILIPALGGLLFGPLIYFFAREAKGHGVPEVMLAVALQGGRIRPAVAVVKSLASAICIGAGGSVGREGPIVQIGSALGSSLGQALRMSDDRIRTLVACGAAGGIAATFNAPIAGVFFALEIILGEFTTRAFGVVVIASVTASVIGRTVFGNVPAFPVPSYQLVSIGEFGLYALLGVLATLIGLAFTRTLYWFEDRFDALPMKEWLKPVPGGLLLGVIGLALPQVFGVGYPAMEQALSGNYAVDLLLVLVVAKILAVSLTLGSGGSGGVFAPSLFLGGMAGTAFGTAAHTLWPTWTASPGAYGLVGMAAVFAAAARAPITAVIILFELTGDYRIILPLMVTVVISTLLSESLSVDTIYTLKLRRRGVVLHAGKDVDLMGAITVGEAMGTVEPPVPGQMTVAEAADLLDQTGGRVLLVADDTGALAGIVTIPDLERALLASRPGAALAEIASRPVLTVFPDQPLTQAIRRMGAQDHGQLPVVLRAAPTQAVGLLRRSDVMRAYNKAVLGNLEAQGGGPVPLARLRGTELVEVPIGKGSELDGRQLRDLTLPPESLVVTIARGSETVIPRGDTRLLGGDRLFILVRPEGVAALHKQLASLHMRGDGRGPKRRIFDQK